MIFTCFTLSALYARRRSYLFLGGKCGLENLERVSTVAGILTRMFPLTPTACGYAVVVGSLPFGGDTRNGCSRVVLLYFGFSQDGFLSLVTGTLMSAMSLMLLSSLGNLFFGSIWLLQVRLCI